jgi:hypothetical protein
VGREKFVASLRDSGPVSHLTQGLRPGLTDAAPFGAAALASATPQVFPEGIQDGIPATCHCSERTIQWTPVGYVWVRA